MEQSEPTSVVRRSFAVRGGRRPPRAGGAGRRRPGTGSSRGRL